MLEKNLDLLIVSVPIVFPHCPPIGPAILKSHLQNHGWSCDTIDLNIELYSEEDLRYLFEISTEAFSFYPPVKVNHEMFLEIYEKGLDGFVKKWAKKVVDASPKRLGLSLFSNHSAYIAERLLFEVRNLSPNLPIVLGGPYAMTLTIRKEDRAFFPVDIDIIAGDGELSVLKYLEGDSKYPGINSQPIQLNDLEIIPIPEYSQRDFDLYDKVDGAKRVYITASRGCIRRCTFCDIKNLWPKYKYRSAQKVFEEIIHLNKTFDRYNINFTDSLVNRNIKVLTELCQMLIEQNSPVEWCGYFICRNKNSMPPSFFQLLADSNCCYLSIGIESGSEKVREYMRKHFSNEEVFYSLEQLTKVGVKSCLLMILGYITEDEAAFQETLDFFDQCIEKGVLYSEDNPQGTVNRINLGFTMAVLPETESQKHLSQINPESPIGIYWHVEKNDRFIRLERLFRAIAHLHHRGYAHLVGNKTGAWYQSLWEEFQEYNRYENVDVDLLSNLAQDFAVNQT